MWNSGGGRVKVITADVFQIVDGLTGKFLRHGIIETPPGLAPCRWAFNLEVDERVASVWNGANVDRWVANDPRDLRKVPAPACGCCGKMERGLVDGRYQITLQRFEDDAAVYWRCEKHVGRNPCCIEGCGKTFPHKPGEDYGWTIMCGRHWRQAPKWMRDAVARVRKIAKRRGWTEALCNRHHRLWERCHRAIREGLAAPALETHSKAIASSGPPPAALVGELERLGL